MLSCLIIFGPDRSQLPNRYVSACKDILKIIDFNVFSGKKCVIYAAKGKIYTFFPIFVAKASLCQSAFVIFSPSFYANAPRCFG